MAYKFQIGASSVSGALEQAGEFSLRSGLASLAGQQPGRRLLLAEEDGNFNIAQHNGSVGLKLSGTLVTATAAELNYVDLTAGTAAASKAIVADGSAEVDASALTWTDLGAVTTCDINGGTIDGATIGAASATTVKGTTVTATTSLTSSQGITGSSLVIGAAGSTGASISNNGYLSFVGMADDWTNAGVTVADLGTVTAATSITATDLVGTNIDGIIGADTARAGTFAAVIGTTGVYSGILKTDDTTEATTTTDGSLQTDGGLSVAKSAVIGDDLDLLSNSAIFKVGSDEPFTLTHSNANNTLMATANNRLAFGNAGEYITGDGTDLAIVSSGDVDITGTTVDVIGALGVTGNAALNGDVDLGNATSDTITATGRFDSALVPSTDSARDLGTTALRWSTIYVDSIVGANVALDVENYGPAPYGTTISASVEFALITSGAVRPGSGGALYTLPVPSAGKILYVKLSGSQANVTLNPSAGTRIEALAMNTAVELESTGSAITCVGMDSVTWWII